MKNVCPKHKGVEAVYLGESSRSAYKRAGDHEAAYRPNKEDSHMWKHVVNEHQGEPFFKMLKNLFS